MYQTLYINPDEEVTSLIGRMKDVQSDVLVFVVPEHSLILGSLINLKLLKRESKRLDKDLIIVTHDTQGLETAKRAGIITRATIQDLPFVQHDTSPQPLPSARHQDISASPASQKGTPLNAPPSDAVTSQLHRQSGSSQAQSQSGKSLDMHAVSISSAQGRLTPTPQTSSESEGKGVHPETQRPILHEHLESMKPQARQASVQNVSTFDSQNQASASTGSVSSSDWGSVSETKSTPPKKSLFSLGRGRKSQKSEGSEKHLEYSSTPQGNPASVQIPPQGGEIVGGRRSWIIGGTVFAAALLALGVGAYIIFPKAIIVLTPRVAEVSGDVSYESTITDDGMQEEAVIMIDKQRAMSREFAATGLGSIGHAKASGTVTLYNEYSGEDQPLVATTRLLTPEGKLFRITKSVIVPGMKEVDGKKVPGSVEVEAQADEAGEEYNIPPSTFTIPGFEGSPKHSAFSARSESSMSGGSSGEGERTVVSGQDIETARAAVRDEIYTTLARETEALGEDRVLVSDALEITFVGEQVSPSVGTVAEKFTYSAQAQIRAVIFSEEAIKKVAWEQFEEDLPNQDVVSWDRDAITIEYGKITTDFEQKKLDIRLHAASLFRAKVDTVAFREDIRGKNMDELQKVLAMHPEIESIDAELEYAYFSQKIPTLDSRIFIEMQ